MQFYRAGSKIYWLFESNCKAIEKEIEWNQPGTLTNSKKEERKNRDKSKEIKWVFTKKVQRVLR